MIHSSSSYLRAIFGKLSEFARDITGLGNPLVLAILGLIVFGWSSNLITLYLLWFGNEVFCSLIKLYFFRPRPEAMRWDNWLSKIEAGSFPSIHASRWMCFASFSLVLLPSSGAVIGLLVTAFLVGWTRIILKKHYLSDVLAGWLIGFAFGWVVGHTL